MTSVTVNAKGAGADSDDGTGVAAEVTDDVVVEVDGDVDVGTTLWASPPRHEVRMATNNADVSTALIRAHHAATDGYFPGGEYST